MNIEVLDSAQQGILPGLAEAFRETALYMAGGTALALQVGHRPSESSSFAVQPVERI